MSAITLDCPKTYSEARLTMLNRSKVKIRGRGQLWDTLDNAFIIETGNNNFGLKVEIIFLM